MEFVEWVNKKAYAMAEQWTAVVEWDKACKEKAQASE